LKRAPPRPPPKADYSTFSGHNPGIQRAANGYQHDPIHQRRNDAARLSLACAHYGVRIAPRQLAAVEDSFQDCSRFGGQLPETDFLLSPKQDAVPQAVGLNQALHKGHLVDAHSQKEPHENRQRFFAPRHWRGSFTAGRPDISQVEP
jgi:hypothetical protein